MKYNLILYFFFISLVSSGQPTIEWQNSYGGTDVDEAKSIFATLDGGYITCGLSRSANGDVTLNQGYNDLWVIKLDQNGMIQWQSSFGGSDYEAGFSIIQTSDLGYIVSGFSNSNNGHVTGNQGSQDYWILKLDSLGGIQWQKSLGGSFTDFSYSIRQTPDGGYVVAGNSNSFDGDVSGNHFSIDYWVVRLDSNGNIIWQKSLGGSGYDAAQSIENTTDGGFLVCGSSGSNDGDVSGNHGSTDYWLVKLDSLGNIQWQKSMGGSDYDYGSSAHQTNDGGYIISGTTLSNDGDVSMNHGNKDYWIVKLDALRNIQWEKSLGGSGNEEAYEIRQTSDNGYIITGFSVSTDGDVTGNHGSADYWVVKLDLNGNLSWQLSLGGSGFDEGRSGSQTPDGGYIFAGKSNSTDGDVTGNHGDYDFWIVKLLSLTTTVVELESPGLQIYPNPLMDELHLRSQKMIGKVEVLDVMGSLIYERDFDEHEAMINLQSLKPGIYFLRNNDSIRKIIKP